jgi:hypothetical protein
MSQHADNIWNEGKFLPLFTDHRRCWKCCPSTRKYLLRLIALLKNTHMTILLMHLQHTRHQLLLDGFSNCVAVLALDLATPISWVRRFGDFLGVCSNLVPMSSNFSSVSTRCICFFSIKCPIVLSLFIKLWIVCLLGNFYHKIYVKIFPDTFQQIRISRRCNTEVHVAVTYSEPRTNSHAWTALRDV